MGNDRMKCINEARSSFIGEKCAGKRETEESKTRYSWLNAPDSAQSERWAETKVDKHNKID